MSTNFKAFREIWLLVDGVHYDSATQVVVSVLRRGAYVGFLEQRDDLVWLAVPHVCTREESIRLEARILQQYQQYGIQAKSIKAPYQFMVDEKQDYGLTPDEVKNILADGESPISPTDIMKVKIEKANPKNKEDFKYALKFAGQLARKLNRAPSALELREAWKNNKLMSMWGNASDFKLDQICNYVAKTYHPNCNL